MLLQLAAIWAIVIATIVWFVRDERRRKAETLARAAERFATDPAWRHRGSGDGVVVLAPRPAASGGLSSSQRRFFDELSRRGLAGADDATRPVR